MFPWRFVGGRFCSARAGRRQRPFGLGLYMLGQSLAYTVMVGLIAVGGS